MGLLTFSINVTLDGCVHHRAGIAPAWSLPLAYKDGVYGAERVPSGAYL